jgi:hypothetical protein
MSDAPQAANPLFDAVAGPVPEQVAPEIALDPERVNAYLSELQSQQSLVKGIGGGFISAIVGAVIWAAVTVVTQYQIGWMAVGIGFLVGMAVRKYGKGLTPMYGVIGAALSLFGCLLGNVLTVGGWIAQQRGLPLIETELALLSNPIGLGQLLMQTFHPMDVLFYAIAVYEGYKFSFHQISETELVALARSAQNDEERDV